MSPEDSLAPLEVAAARLWAAHRFPYLASALFATRVQAAPGLGGIAADEAWTLHVDSEVARSWTPAQLGSLFVHHTGHLLREHAERARQIPVRPEEAGAWTAAADAELNDDLVDAGLDQPGFVILPAHLGAEPGRLAEEYFHAGRDRRDFPPACGSGADGQPRPWDRPGTEGPDREAARILRWQVAAEIADHARQAGRVPAGWRRWAEAVLAPRTDWRRVLAAEVRKGLGQASGMVDYTYRRPSRRAAAAGPVVLPSFSRPNPQIAVVCDTSGSMSDELLARALAEVDGLARANQRGAVRVLACDAAAGAAQRVLRASQMQLTGGGGTDMGVGIGAAARLRPRPDVVVVLTDGHTPWQADPPPGLRVVAGLLGPAAPTPPRWARAVRIGGWSAAP